MLKLKSYIATVVTLIVFWGLSFLVYFHFENVKRLQNNYYHSKKVIDSLSSEMIYKDIEIGRYEIILDRLQTKYPTVLDEVILNLE
jgi:hypothetical protein